MDNSCDDITHWFERSPFKNSQLPKRKRQTFGTNKPHICWNVSNKTDEIHPSIHWPHPPPKVGAFCMKSGSASLYVILGTKLVPLCFYFESLPISLYFCSYFFVNIFLLFEFTKKFFKILNILPLKSAVPQHTFLHK